MVDDSELVDPDKSRGQASDATKNKEEQAQRPLAACKSELRSERATVEDRNPAWPHVYPMTSLIAWFLVKKVMQELHHQQ